MQAHSVVAAKAPRRENNMDELKKIAVLDNMVEAQLLDSILTERDIPHVMKTYHDSACDGLFQASMGWGHVEAPETRQAEILGIIEELRTQNGGNPDEQG